MNTIHVIGAGLAGLSAAVTASGAGRAVVVHEATAAGGGRCRSRFDTELGIYLDNGNHLLLSGNEAAFAYIKAINALDRVTGPRRPVFPFKDLKSGRSWTLKPSKGVIPWWLLFSGRRVPNTTVGDYLTLAAVGRERNGTVVADAIRHNELYSMLLEPLAIAALNTQPDVALASLFGTVLRETLLKGGSACLPRLPVRGLSDALVDPAIETLRNRGVRVLFNQRVTGMIVERGRVAALQTNAGRVALEPDDAVVLAVPAWVAGELLPGMTVPNAFESILNVHYRVSVTPDDDIKEAGFIGLVNGTAEWIFVRPDHVSVTVSAANRLIDRAADDLASAIWPDVVSALKMGAMEMPPFRVIKERRATIVANAEQECRRPDARTEIANLTLAGDWTNTQLPGTIEGAVRSGFTAARLLLGPAGSEKKKVSLHDA